MQLVFRVLYSCARIIIGALALAYLARLLPGGIVQRLHLESPWVLLALSFVINAFYRLWFYPRYRSPLRHLPTIQGGKPLELITEAPRGKSPLKWFQENPEADLIHVRGLVGKSNLFPASPNALREVLSTNTYDFEKPWGLRSFLARVIGWGLITSEGNSHKHQRRALTPAFNIKHIRALYEPMWETTLAFVDAMGADADAKGLVEIGEWASRFALDIIGNAALSRDFRSLTTDGENRIVEAFLSILEPEPHMVVFFGLNMIISPAIMRWLPFRANKIMDRECAYLRQVCVEILDEKQNNIEVEKSVGADDYSILQRVIESEEFPRDELVDQMLTFIAAGHETTGSSISWAMHLLTLPEFQHYQKVLRDEVRTNLSKIKACIESNDRTLHTVFETSMPYVNGVCEEILRLFPAVPATIREAVRDTSICRNIVPVGTLIVLSPWAVNRNPRYWGANADKLYPERWIDTLPDGTKRSNKHGGAASNYCEITFLHGQRACIGRDFAKAELRCAIAGIFGRFEVSRLPGDNGDVEITGAVTTKPRGGLRIHLTRV